MIDQVPLKCTLLKIAKKVNVTICNLPKKRERESTAQIAFVQKEQNLFFVSLILEDKIREVKELFWSW